MKNMSHLGADILSQLHSRIVLEVNVRSFTITGWGFRFKYSCLGDGAFEAVNNRDPLSQHHPHGRVQLCGVVDG